MERENFLRDYSRNTRVSFSCSKCSRGSVTFPFDSLSRVGGVFAGTTKCNACRENYAFAGACSKAGGDWSFSLRYVGPPVDFFVIPRECPDEIRREIRRAFSISWSGTDAAANTTRSVVEKLLDGARVRKYARKSKRLITTHDRILDFHQKKPDLADLFLAMKWLGNEGSHSATQLTAEDILDDFEILEHALILLYSSRQVSAIARKINKKRGSRN